MAESAATPVTPAPSPAAAPAKPAGLRLTLDRVMADLVADKLVSVVTRLREMSPLYELAKEGVDLSTMQWEAH